MLLTNELWLIIFNNPGGIVDAVEDRFPAEGQLNIFWDSNNLAWGEFEFQI